MAVTNILHHVSCAFCPRDFEIALAFFKALRGSDIWVFDGVSIAL